MKETYQLFVGTYSRPIRFGTGEILEGRGKGIHRYTFDAKTGTLYESTAPAPAENPSYLALSFDKQYLYAVNELKEYKNKAGGAVSVYRIESDGGLRFGSVRPEFEPHFPKTPESSGTLRPTEFYPSPGTGQKPALTPYLTTVEKLHNRV